ncbi:CpaF family protein [Thomasclavelia cocleata]|uniref:Pilus assembly protein CpaF n=2 Tax=Thomasclavelia cocleata TaxID=69824 RepID=A0A1I0DY46_9FIRM|nr:CpaF family protein [Thomasclavelia cocleata]MCR1961191.1 CpaF family protein [Thomasclavelia cocleata]NDO42077.1 CpaF family protein [Thomasclavelia cocleata]GFI40516.1 putative conjugal transfer protein [Thomasclavelia cocleata]SET36952.1 pilus assembly protein CpaF [Thomasclavelia cocleata]
MDEEYKNEVIARTKDILLKEYSLNEFTDDLLQEKISEIILQITKGVYISIKEQVDLINRVYSSIRGLDILDSIINDDNITEIMINGHENIFIEKSGKLTKLAEKFESEERLEDIIQKIVGLAGREVNQANPIVDTRLPNGSRVNVVLPPISLNGPIVTIRKFSKTPMTMEQLIKFGSITPKIAEILKCLVKAKYNIFVSGGTGSGKTTFLNALSNYIPKEERIITIEDSAELQLVGIENLVSLETRNANTTGAGAISIRDLIKSSLRMRPERIIVGEVRGGEALDMLQAMNTGHDGSLSTGHANSTKDMLSRLETMVLTGSEGLPLEAVRQQIASSLDIIIHLSRLRDHSRKTMEISEVLGYENGEIILNPIYQFIEDENTTLEKVSGSLSRTSNEFKNTYKLKLAGFNIEI